MSEKSALLPTAPAEYVQVQATGSTVPPQQQPGGPSAIPMPKLVIVPGFEFDPTRKYRYGMHAALAAVLVFVAFVLVELRDCNWGPGIDLDKLQALHVAMMVFAFVLYLLSLFGIADFIFKFRLFFLFGVLLIYVFVGIMIWMCYEAAANPCVKVANFAPIDFSPGKNVFSRGDGVGIVVLLLDIVATLMMFSAAANFYKRY